MSINQDFSEDHALVTSARILSNIAENRNLFIDEADNVNKIGKLTAPVENALAKSGAFSALFPSYLGGPGMRLDDQFELLRDVSYCDGSIGWNLSILMSGGFFAGTVDCSVAKEIYPTLTHPTAVTNFPLGIAKRNEPGKLNIQGNWSFASGVKNSEYIVLGVRIQEEEDQNTEKNQICWVWVPTIETECTSDWVSTGLCGTGSVNVSVRDLQIDARHIIDYMSLPPQGDLSLPPNSRYRSFLAAKGVGVPIGIARRALDEYETQLNLSQIGEKEVMAVSKAEALISASESVVREHFRHVSDLVWNNLPLSLQDEGKLNSLMPLVGDLCYKAVDIILDAIGARATLATTPFDRIFRDIATVRRHLVYQNSYYTVGGKLYLGIAESGQWK